MSRVSKAGIETSADGASYIPSSQRPDGSTRKEIRVRPGYRPPEDIETYKNRSAAAWKNRGKGGVPGADTATTNKDDGTVKSRNARRREAARKKVETEEPEETGLTSALQNATIADVEKPKENGHNPSKLATNEPTIAIDDEAEQQKKIRNQLKKLKAVRELKQKKAAGEKLSHDQLMKISKEGELLRDLKKLGYEDVTEVSETKDVPQPPD